MICVYEAKTPARYAINLRLNKMTNCLEWDSPSGQTTLIIQCPFGDRPVDRIEEICAAIQETEIGSDAFSEILPDIYARIISAADKGRLHGCPLNGASRTYMVFACDINSEKFTIYEPQMQAMSAPYCDIPILAQVRVTEQKKMAGLIKKQEVPTGFYTIEFIGDTLQGYTSGDLMYSVGKFEMPITTEMVRQKKIYVKTKTRPEVKAARKGIKLQ